MEIRILGPLEVTVRTQVLDFGGSRQRALLARLAVAANRVVAVDALLDDLWGSQVPPGAKQALQAQASRIRRALGDSSRVVSRAPGYVLRLEPDELDAARFETLLGRARTASAGGDLDGAVRLWVEAQACWRGPALPELQDYAFAQAEAARLEELRLAAMEARVQVELDLGRHDELAGELEALVAEHPYRERLWGHLMLALYRSGRQADALRAYQRVRSILSEELGINPGTELVRLEEAILLQDPELTRMPRQSPVGPKTAQSNEPPHNLPRPRSSFVGRHQELDELEKLLRGSELLTVVGPGGVGKTRLTVEVARRALGDFPDGVWLVELAPVRDPSLVSHAVAAALGLSEDREQPVIDTLASALAQRKALLVLDNCEHLVDAAAALADALLAVAPDLKVLATSREPLRVEGEVVWRAPSLPVPLVDEGLPDAALSFDAVRLFCERAAAQGSFVLDADNATAVSQLCRRLDGIPLALELAAARSGALAPTDMLARLHDRFALLSQGRRTALPRQQTLGAAIGWSYELLSPAEQALFRRLSVFAGGWTGGAAEAVCTDEMVDISCVTETLSRLVDKSLVIAEASAGVMRYRMLETLREYGASSLDIAGEAERFRQRHLEWMTAMTTEAEPELIHRTSRWQPWLERLEREHANISAALRWAADREWPEPGLWLAATTPAFWHFKGRTKEGRRWLDDASAKADACEPQLAARLLAGAAAMAMGQRDPEAPQPLLERALVLARDAGDRGLQMYVTELLGALWSERGKYHEAIPYFEEKLALALGARDDTSAAQALHNLGFNASLLGDMDAARTYLTEALTIERAQQNKAGMAYTLNDLGLVMAALGDTSGGLALCEESLALCRDLGDAVSTCAALNGVGRLSSAIGDRARAETLYREALALSKDSGFQWNVAESLEGLANVAVASGNRQRGACLLGAVSALRPTEHPALDDPAFVAWFTEGQRMPLEQAIAYALAG